MYMYIQMAARIESDYPIVNVFCLMWISLSYRMEIWPGYVTAIHQFDGGLLLLLDVSHKLLRMDSALNFL